MKIPLLNVANLYLCVYNLNAIPTARKHIFRALGYAFVYTVPAWFLWSALYKAVSGRVPLLESVIFFAGIYLIPMLMSHGLIRFQEKYVFHNNENREEPI
jgi:hypothetical protein